jgi:hypothetical protein
MKFKLHDRAAMNLLEVAIRELIDEYDRHHCFNHNYVLLESNLSIEV